MKLQISVSVEREVSKRAVASTSYIVNESNSKVIADYLNVTFSEDLDDVNIHFL